MTIVPCDNDGAAYVGDGVDGCYVHLGKDDDGWYYTVVVDSDTGNFVDDLATDIGPYALMVDALRAGVSQAQGWCIDNQVDWHDNEEPWD